MHSDSTGYIRPRLKSELDDQDVDRIYSFCPGVVQAGQPDARAKQAPNNDEVWGPWYRMERVHAANPDVRHRGATSGALTALGQYLIDSETVSFVLHVRQGGTTPEVGRSQVSRSAEQVFDGIGSCYAPAAPLDHVVQCLEQGKKFAVIAKPCDLSALRLLAEDDPRVDELITHRLAMVCGGIMPPFGMRAFYRREGINPDDVAAVSYRGNGCPGPTRITLKNGQVIDKTYLEFWGTDASMWHLPWRCKVCPDGNGEAADIAVSDTWPGGSPTPESCKTDPGSNAAIARTAAGAVLLQQALDAGYLVSECLVTVDDMTSWQPHQVAKKEASEARYDGMEAAGHMRIKTIGLRTRALRKRMTAESDEDQVRGTQDRIAIGKHRDDFGK